MTPMTVFDSLDPLDALPIDPVIAALPKAELHLHQEWSPRLDRVLARRAERPSYDWRGWARDLMATTPPGMARLRRLAKVFPAMAEEDAAPENFIARVEDLLTEAAADGAILVEMRFGNETLLRPDLMALFREAERRTQTRYPTLRAEATATLIPWHDPARLEQLFDATLRAAHEGLTGIDLLYEPYDAEADWAPIYRAAAAWRHTNGCANVLPYSYW